MDRGRQCHIADPRPSVDPSRASATLLWSSGPQAGTPPREPCLQSSILFCRHFSLSSLKFLVHWWDHHDEEAWQLIKLHRSAVGLVAPRRHRTSQVGRSWRFQVCSAAEVSQACLLLLHRTRPLPSSSMSATPTSGSVLDLKTHFLLREKLMLAFSHHSLRGSFHSWPGHCAQSSPHIACLPPM
jgi:hypothetical protein